MALLTESQLEQVSDAISRVEQKTDAELVTVLAYQADSYHYIPTLWAAMVALAGLITTWLRTPAAFTVTVIVAVPLTVTVPWVAEA